MVTSDDRATVPEINIFISARACIEEEFEHRRWIHWRRSCHRQAAIVVAEAKTGGVNEDLGLSPVQLRKDRVQRAVAEVCTMCVGHYGNTIGM